MHPADPARREDRDPGGVRWSLDGTGVYFALADQGTSNVQFAALKAGGGARKVTEGNQMVSLTSIARNGSAVGVRANLDNPAARLYPPKILIVVLIAVVNHQL